MTKARRGLAKRIAPGLADVTGLADENFKIEQKSKLRDKHGERKSKIRSGPGGKEQDLGDQFLLQQIDQSILEKATEEQRKREVKIVKK